MPHDEQVHRALASPIRTRLLAVVRASSEAVDVEHLASSVGLHPNTVRGHLSVLQEAGLVERDTQRPDDNQRGRGRPRVVFRAPAVSEEPGGSDGYRFLAAVLAGSFADTVPEASARAEDAGRAWGQHLVEAPEPGERLSDAEIIERLCELLDLSGFAPRVTGGATAQPQIALRRCPFLDIAGRNPEVVCAVHLGMIRGALEELGSSVTASALIAAFDGEPCRAELVVAP